jgi:hypothetical protein
VATSSLGFLSDTTANKLLRLDWIEALQTPGCALCHMSSAQKPALCRNAAERGGYRCDQRDSWRELWGLCHWHAWMATETPHSAGSLAILYADVLRHDFEHLAELTALTHQATSGAAFASFTVATPAGLALLATATTLSSVPPA